MELVKNVKILLHAAKIASINLTMQQTGKKKNNVRQKNLLNNVKSNTVVSFILVRQKKRYTSVQVKISLNVVQKMLAAVVTMTNSTAK